MGNKRLKSIFHNMKTRCYNPNSKFYKWYGAKGITICNEWLESYNVFEKWAIENGYSDSLTIDRIDSEKGYEPSNCRWVTRQEQANNRNSNHLISFNNEQHSIADWAKITGISHTALKQRIAAGWTIEEALTTPQYSTNKTRNLTYNGITKRMSEWADEYGINYSTLQNRINLHGWDIERALTTPTGSRQKKAV